MQRSAIITTKILRSILSPHFEVSNLPLEVASLLGHNLVTIISLETSKMPQISTNVKKEGWGIVGL